MGQIQLSYSTFGLTELDFLDAIDAVDRAGYPGIEISFHRDQFNPFNIDDDYLAQVKRRLAERRSRPPASPPPRTSSIRSAPMNPR